MSSKVGSYRALAVGPLPEPPEIPYWLAPRGDDHLLVARVADALTRYPGSPLAGLGLDDRERAVKRVLAEVEASGYVVRRRRGGHL